MALTEVYFIWVGTSVVVAVAAYTIAKRNGYNPVIAVISGLILNVFALAVLVFLDRRRNR